MAPAALLCACVSAGERELRAELDHAGATLSEVSGAAEPDAPEGAEPAAADEAVRFDGDPQTYVDYALSHDPGLRAAWERWRAATHRVARERRLPMPTLTYSVFVSQVETRVGPQRMRLGLRQRFPWPGALLAGADAAAAEARVLQRDFEARALEVRAEVLMRYWSLWLVRAVRGIEGEELEIYAGLAELARGRLEVGGVDLAEVQQIDLQRARAADELAALDELEHKASARLRAALGVPLDVELAELPTFDALPGVELPSATETELRADLDAHPLLGRWQTQAQASELRGRQARRARAPGFSVGVDWIEVGPARAGTHAEGASDSGKDAASVSVGLELPLWQRNYAEDEKAAQADAAAARSEREAARLRAAAELSTTLATLRDSARRVELHEATLIPQARGALEASLGGYAVGEVELSAVFFAQRQLLELRQAALRLHADHAAAWASLERVVGHGVEGQAVPVADNHSERSGEESDDGA